MRERVREKVFCEFYPAGGAGCDHGQNALRSDPFDQFMSFLQNRQVGGELSIEDLRKSEPAQSGNHLPCHKASGVHSHGFADTDTDCRSCLHDHDFFRVSDLFKHHRGVIPLDDGAGGTDKGTLSAIRTRNVAEAFFHVCGYFCPDATLR